MHVHTCEHICGCTHIGTGTHSQFPTSPLSTRLLRHWLSPLATDPQFSKATGNRTSSPSLVPLLRAAALGLQMDSLSTSFLPRARPPPLPRPAQVLSHIGCLFFRFHSGRLRQPSISSSNATSQNPLSRQFTHRQTSQSQHLSLGTLYYPSLLLYAGLVHTLPASGAVSYSSR